MITVEKNEYATRCDNCPARPRELQIVRGELDGKEHAEYCLTLCKRCLKRIGKEMVNWKPEVSNARS